jgi:hypothetical protein
VSSYIDCLQLPRRLISQTNLLNRQGHDGVRLPCNALPSPLKDLNVSQKQKQWKSKELGHVP